MNIENIDENNNLSQDIKNRWLLKTPDNKIYGPVTNQTLILWAEEGRIGPDCMVKFDDGPWQKAIYLPQLKMEWFIVWEDNTLYGPINFFFLRQLLLDGMVNRNTVVFHKNTGLRYKIEDLKDKIFSDNNSNSIKKLISQIISQNETINNLRSKTNKLTLENITASTKLDQMKQEMDKLIEEKRGLEKEIDIYKIQLEKIINTINRNRTGAIDWIKSKCQKQDIILQIEDKLELLIKEKSTLDAEIKKRKQIENTLQQEIEALKHTLKIKEEEISQLISENKNLIDSYKKEISSFERRILELNSTLEEKNNKIVSLMEKYENILSENKSTKNNLNILKEDSEKLKRELHLKDKEINTLKKELSIRNSLIEELNKKLNSSEDICKKLKETVEQMKIQYDTILRRMIKENEELTYRLASLKTAHEPSGEKTSIEKLNISLLKKIDDQAKKEIIAWYKKIKN